MKILGIDYGKKKVGIAYAETFLSEPLQVIHYEEKEVLIERLKRLVAEKEIEQVVVGISEGEMAIESKVFGEELKKHLLVPISFFDETLSTEYAKNLAIEAGVGRKKRREMEDAFAASVMLQNYLDQKTS